jgi:hypothetical protein
MACGRSPESGADLASQPTLSRLENAPDVRALIRLSHGIRPDPSSKKWLQIFVGCNWIDAGELAIGEVP